MQSSGFSICTIIMHLVNGSYYTYPDTVHRRAWGSLAWIQSKLRSWFAQLGPIHSRVTLIPRAGASAGLWISPCTSSKVWLLHTLLLNTWVILFACVVQTTNETVKYTWAKHLGDVISFLGSALRVDYDISLGPLPNWFDHPLLPGPCLKGEYVWYSYELIT